MELWTGLACLVADPKCEEFRRFGDDGKGAYVNIVAWANSEESFVERVKEVDGTQLLDSRMEEPDYPDELITMRATARPRLRPSGMGEVRVSGFSLPRK
jgi:hypothetical protein